MDASEWITTTLSVGALGVATLSHLNARKSREAAEKAAHRALTPIITATCDGKMGTTEGFVVHVTSNTDLDEMSVKMTETKRDGSDFGFLGVASYPANVTMLKSGANVTRQRNDTVGYRRVRAGQPVEIIVRDRGDIIPKTVQFDFHITGWLDGVPDRWVVLASTGEVEVRYSTT